MAKIESYTIADSPLSGSDKMIGTDTAHNNATKNFTISELASFIGDGITLQQVLDNDHSLTDGNNYQGTNAGTGNTGSQVNAFGTSAAQNNVGIYINAFGEEALKNNTANNSNGIGFRAGINNTGYALQAIGPYAAHNNTGYGVTAIGSNAGYNNIGDNLIAIGASTGGNNTGSDVVLIGNGAGTSNTFSFVTLLGQSASADANNQLVFSNENLYNARISSEYLTGDKKYKLPDNNGTFVLSVNGNVPNATTGDVTLTIPTPTLQQVLDYNHALTNGNNFQGTDAGLNNTGTNVIGFGTDAAKNNSGNFVVALGNSAGQNNTRNNVVLLGTNANANGNNQLTFANSAGSVGRISFNGLTSNHGYALPNADGTFVLSVNGTAPDSTGNVSLSVGLPYKSYVINLGWDGATWTVTDTYENTLGGSVTLSSGAAGRLRLTTSGLFTSGKTVVIPCVISGQATLLGVLDFTFSSFPNDIYVRWNNASGGIATPSSFGTNIPYILEVRVYN